ncbi:MAG: DNA-binding protein [Thermodesulfobacteriota bacterium]|nr:DNA-binding protein [Thermodesulfobacteriota bacterium]
MQTITVKNIPPEIHKSLKNMAKINRRSLNGEIIYCLEKYTKMSTVDTRQLISKARNIRSRINHTFSDQEIENAKNEGRR